MKTVGFIVNPIAGMGGAVGLKGTDGKATLKRAKALGAQPIAPVRAKRFLTILFPEKSNIRLLTGRGSMGEQEAEECGFSPIIIGEIGDTSTAEDTKKVARRIKDMEADLLVFCGGDGTARDILDVVGTDLPVLGVPTGVKMHSAIFSVTPEAAASIVMQYLWNEVSFHQNTFS